jgi:hypothetical protein
VLRGSNGQHEGRRLLPPQPQRWIHPCISKNPFSPSYFFCPTHNNLLEFSCVHLLGCSSSVISCHKANYFRDAMACKYSAWSIWSVLWMKSPSPPRRTLHVWSTKWSLFVKSFHRWVQLYMTSLMSLINP